MNTQQIFDLDRAAMNAVESIERRRAAFDALNRMEGRPFTAIIGPRGAGKTVLLRQMRADREHAVYISADTMDSDVDLFAVVRALHDQFKVKDFFIDEIHFIRDYAAHLKKAFDFLPVRIWFTSSMALALDETKWDLSRRVIVSFLLPFTYGEFLRFAENAKTEDLTLDRALSDPPPRLLRVGGRFHEYLRGGMHPFLLERGSELVLFENIVHTVISRDIPAVDPTVTVGEITTMERAVQFIARAAVDGVNYSTLAANLGITKYKSEQILARLETSFIAIRVFPGGTNVLREPKVLLQLPYRLLYQPFDSAVGALREDFFALAMRQHGQSFSYAKSTRGRKTPDYVLHGNLSGTVVEIGGKGKGRTQFKGLTYDRKVVLFDGDDSRETEITGGERVPLFMIGFAPG
mgnify:CR=1 FL=1